MKRFLFIAASFLFLFQSANFSLAEEKTSLAGTWEGIIYIPGLDIDMEITLHLMDTNGQISGKIKDDWGYLDCDITDPELDNDTLTFKAMVVTSQDEHQMVFKMTVAGDKMRGQWESLGSFGEWSMERRVENDGKPGKEYEIKDILGVWRGPAAYKSNPGSKNILTLKLEEREGELHGSFSDQFGNTYNSVKIKNFEGNNLLLDVSFSWKNDDYIMEVDLTIKDDSHMRGKFTIPKMGRTGVWKAEKENPNAPK